MMWLYVGDAANWMVARLLDSAARGDDLPGWAPEAGWLLIGAALFTVLWLGVRWLRQRREERDQPPPGNLLDSQEWLADRTEEIPAPPRPRYRGRRRAPREPRNGRPRQHVVPAHPLRPDVAATQVIARVTDDVEATAILVRPRGRGGAR